MKTKPIPTAQAADVRGHAVAERREFSSGQAHRPMMAELYHRAEAQMRKQPKMQKSKAKLPKSEADPQRLLHELQVHQIELELQNEELRQARDAMEAGLEKYSDLYDFAPVGYLSLDRMGDITEANLAGASLLGCARAALMKQRFGAFVAPADRSAFAAFLQQVFKAKASEECDVRLLVKGKAPVDVRMRAIVSTSGQACRVAVTDVTEHKQAEEKVRVSEVRYRRLFEAAHDGVLILDPGTRKITEANPFMTKLLGYQHQQLVGKELFEIGLLKDEAASHAMFQKLKHDREVRYENLPLVSRGGRHQEVEVVANLYQENGRAVIQCNIRDITERKRTEEALCEGEERYRNLFNSMDEGYCTIEMIFDEQGKPVDYRYLEINPSFERLTGMHGALGKRVREFVPDLEEHWFEMYGQVARTGEPIRVADEVKGMNRWFDIHAFRIGGKDSRKLAVFFRNITERKLAEEALRQSEERYHTLFTSIDEGFCVIESIFDKHDKPIDYRFLEVNPTFTKQTGLREPVGKRMRELVPEIEDHWIDIYGQVALTGEPIRFVNEARAMDGRWFDVYACRVGEPDSRKVAIIFNDITARKNTEQQLEEKARLLDLSHDAIIVRDMKGHIRYWNHGAEELYGWSRKEALGKVSHRLLQTEFPTPVKQMMAELLRTDRWIGELVHTTRAGRRITVLARKTLDRDSRGHPVAVLENISDITARKHAEEALRTSEAFNRSVVESSPDCIKVLDPAGKLLSFLRGAQELLGIDDVRPYLNQSWIKFWAGQDRQAARRAVAAAAAGREGNFVGFFRTPRGEPKWWDVKISPILAADGQPARLLAVSRDVTERKWAELNLAFLASVSQDLVRATGVDEMMRTIGAKIGAHFKLSACAFVAVNEAASEVVVSHDWHRKGVPGLVGTYRQADFVEEEFTRLARAGETIVVRDVATDPRTNPKKFAALKIGSFLCAPFLRDGQWLFALCLYHSTPYEWRTDEIELARELTLRLWTRLERLRAMDALQESEDRYRTLFKLGPVAVYAIDTPGVIQNFNPRAAELWGRTPALGDTDERFCGSHKLFRSDGSFMPHDQTPMAEVVAGKIPGAQDLEVLIERPDGSRINVIVNIRPLKNERGEITGAINCFYDITERKRAEEALSASEERFRAAVGAVSSLIWTNNAKGLMEGEQPGWTSFTGQTLKEYQGYGWAKAVHPKDAPPTLAAWKRAVAKKSIFEFEHRVRRRDGEWRLCSIRAVPLLDDDGQIREWVGVHTDITERKQAEETERRVAVLDASNRKLEKEIVRRQAVEEALQTSEQHQRRLLEQSNRLQEQLRQLSRQILTTQEEERREISRELHDVIAQTLSGINLRLAGLKKEAALSTKGLHHNIARTQRQVEKSVDIVHQFARELRPAVLDDLGLIPALHAFMKSFTTRTGIRTRLTAFAAVKQLDTARSTTLFRVAQEAFTNVARHAKASRVDVSIQKLPGGVCMKIKDDGKSFDVERVMQTTGKGRLGLLGMRERLEMVGGKFTVESAPGEGTVIIADLLSGKNRTQGGGGGVR